MIVLLALVYVIIGIIDLPVLLKTNQRMKVLAVYVGLLGLGFLLAYLQTADIAPHSPSVWIEMMVRSVLGK